MEKILTLISSSVSAQDAVGAGDINLTPAGYTGVSDLTIAGIISGLVILVLVIAALLAFFFLIYGGIKWITSGGDKEQTAAAQSTLTSAIIGLAIVFSTWAIISLIETFLGISIFGGTTGGLKIPTAGIGVGE